MSPEIFCIEDQMHAEREASLLAMLRRAGDAYRGRDALGPDDLATARWIEDQMIAQEHDEMLDAGIPTEIEEHRDRSMVQRHDAAIIALHALSALLSEMYRHLDDLAGDAERLAQTIGTDHRAEIEQIERAAMHAARQAWSLAAVIDGIEPDDR